MTIRFPTVTGDVTVRACFAEECTFTDAKIEFDTDVLQISRDGVTRTYPMCNVVWFEVPTPKTPPRI